MPFIFVSSIAVLAVLVIGVTAKRHSYYKNIEKAKERCLFQTMPSCKTLIPIYTALDGGCFSWSKSLYTIKCWRPVSMIRWDYASAHCDVNLLWYYVIQSGNHYLIDMPWLELMKFRVWCKLYDRKKNRRVRLENQNKNNSNDVLEDVKRKLNNQIELNNQRMAAAVEEQKEITRRLTPFEEDYVKSQITVVK